MISNPDHEDDHWDSDADLLPCVSVSCPPVETHELNVTDVGAPSLTRCSVTVEFCDDVIGREAHAGALERCDDHDAWFSPTTGHHVDATDVDTTTDVVRRIDAVIGCQHCGAALDGSPSDDFCDEECQISWHAERADVLYEESDVDDYDYDDDVVTWTDQSSSITYFDAHDNVRTVNRVIYVVGVTACHVDGTTFTINATGQLQFVLNLDSEAQPSYWSLWLINPPADYWFNGNQFEWTAWTRRTTMFGNRYRTQLTWTGNVTETEVDLNDDFSAFKFSGTVVPNDRGEYYSFQVIEDQTEEDR